MSDTTITITPEERARIRAIASNTSMLSYRDGIHDALNSLLTALEAAEKALLKEEVYSEELESQLQDAESEYNANWAVQAISDVARLVGVYEQCSETGDDIGAAVIEAVQDLKSEKDAAEARAVRAEKEEKFLTAKLLQTGCVVQPDGSFFLEHVPGIIRQKIEQAEAENARLRAERDWLVKKLADISDKMNRPGAPTFCAACNICPVGDHEMEGRTCAVAIEEAARRAVGRGRT